MTSGCTHSIGRRLSAKLALVTMLVLGAMFTATWLWVGMNIRLKNAEDLQYRSAVIAQILTLELKGGGIEACLSRVRADAAMRANTRLELWRTDGVPLYADEDTGLHAMSPHTRSADFDVAAPALPGGVLKVRYTMDFERDRELGRRWALVLVAVTLASGALVGIGTRWHVGRQLGPLRQLAAQTRAISVDRLDQRLALPDPAEELLPWIEQFNALMERLERAMAQLEAFNADVAHELRTPLAALMGQTEVALSRERPNESLRETLHSNLEELQRMSAMVNDMLFLSHAERGAVARRGAAQSLAGLARQVVEFHEAPLEEAGLSVQVEGDMPAAVDEPLFKRAISNLLGNAIRYAERGSRIVIAIAPQEAGQVRVVVQNDGPVIAPEHLARLFDRFFRADSARQDGQHHGLGLAIVAAIARMHAGRPVAESSAGRTRVGFTLVPQ